MSESKQQKTEATKDSPLPKLTGAAKDLASAASESVSGVHGAVRDAASQVTKAVGDAYGSLGDQARDSFSQGRESVKQWEQGIEEVVQQRPVAALLVAAGVGFVLASLFLDGPRR